MRLVAAALILSLGCIADPVLAPRDCTPGTTTACACLGGSAGVQVCSAEGRVGTCACPDGSAGVDVNAAHDVQLPQDVGVDAFVTDRPDAQPDGVATNAPDVISPSDVVDVAGQDVRIYCGDLPQRCGSHAHCTATCEPRGVDRLPWCCSPGGFCLASSRPTCL